MARRNFKRPLLIVVGLGLVALVVLGGVRFVDGKLPAAAAATPALVEEGKYLAIAGDCAACHTRPGGPAFAGGVPLHTPFGVIYAPNITPDAKTGIGEWSREDFIRAMRRGLDHHRMNLYPAFPYPYYARVTVKDLDAIHAYLKAQPAVSYDAPKNELGFPFNIRLAVTGWNWLHFRGGEFKPDTTKSAEWNRGAYLFDGLGHCAACHSPRNAMGGEKSGQKAQGGEIDTWWAPDLTGNARTGLGKWSVEEIAQFLKTGTNAHSQVYGSMTEVVQNSTSLMTDADLRAMAVYIKSLPARADGPAPAKVDAAVLAAAQPLYVTNCALCHGMEGAGIPGVYPPLAGNAGLQAPNPASVIHIALAGNRPGPHTTIKGLDPMPPFAEKLNDKDMASILTFARNSWGNAATPVTADQVAKMRGRVKTPAAEHAPGAPTTPAGQPAPKETGPATAG